MNYPLELVLEVNRVYHDCEQADYDSKHPEILTEEVNRWQELGQRFVAGPAPKKILDLGSGTGFVPLQLAPMLGPEDSLVSSDISAGMLEVCRTALEQREFVCGLDFLHLDGQTIQAPDKEFDCVTMNSVLHHLPDFGFLREIGRVLKPGGRLIICHEHNRAFYTNPLLVANFFVFFVLLHPKKLLAKFTKKSKVSRSDEQLFDRVNEELMARDITTEPMPKSQIVEIVDIHSPFAGGRFHRDRGIDIASLHQEYIPGSRLEYFSTYDHLDMLTNRNALTQTWSNLLGKLLPYSGATFAAVISK